MKKTPQVYCTTYCNHGHYVKTGKPVNHDCYTLPPEAIRLEMAGEIGKAIETLEAWVRSGRGSPR